MVCFHNFLDGKELKSTTRESAGTTPAYWRIRKVGSTRELVHRSRVGWDYSRPSWFHQIIKAADNVDLNFRPYTVTNQRMGENICK